MTEGRVTWPRLSVGLLALPIGLFLAFFFFYPAINLLLFSVLTQNAQGIVGRPFTAAHFAHFFGTGLYMKVFLTTLRISLLTSVVAAALAYPVAIVILRSRPLVTRAVNLIVIAPLLVSVVVRAYGWQLILANGPAGVVNKILLGLGLIDSPLSLLYSDTAVVIGSLHVFFPMMVLPLVATLGKVDRNLEDAARMLGASSLRVFLRVTFPLSLPGLLLGFALVFTLTAGSFVTPAILGGTNTMMLGNLIEQQIFVV